MNNQELDSKQGMNRRHWLQVSGAIAFVAGSTAISALPSTALAQSWPARPIKLMVPWPAGGLVDVAARQLATRLQTTLGQPVVVENKLGAGGNIGADQIAKAPADGYNLLFSTSALSISTAMRATMPFDLQKDLEPIALVATAPSVLVVGPSFNPGSIKELIDAAKQQPGKFSYASAGIGSPAHMTAELFKVRHKLFVVHVPYTGAPAAMFDQIGGRIDYQFANAAVALPQIRAGKVKALAVTSATRLASLPQVPTMSEAGVPNFEVDQWLGLLAPRGLPKAIAERLSAEVAKIQSSEEFRQTLVQANMNPAATGSAASFENAIKQDIEKWAAVVKAQGIKAE